MKIIVTANIVPFMPGGADYHINGVAQQLRLRGHDVELLRFPFRFSPEADIERMMAFCEGTSLQGPNGVNVDKVISLQFPAYAVQHNDHRVWIMHQHRAAYELFDEQTASVGMKDLRPNIVAFDERVLSKATHLFANSQRVADRLKQYNGLSATPLYHPPHAAEAFYCGEAEPYIFYPSRLEDLKRQDLLIRAAAHLKTPVKIIIGGDGGKKRAWQQLIQDLDLQDRVRLIGRFSEAEKLAYYARALAVYFGPFDEDYGYITLEAMLSSKPVISCEDSGGPLEFVRNNDTGFIVPPEPEAIAEKMDWLYTNQKQAAEMGVVGRQTYQKYGISWDNVVEQLLKK
jgi:glycosyltransferase involved in cell wall biosynthesis